MPTGAQKLAQQQLAREAPAVDFPQAQITAVTAGGAKDGNALVTVVYRGASLQLPYLSHYTPVVGHMVPVALVEGVLTIWGRPIGFPPDS